MKILSNIGEPHLPMLNIITAGSLLEFSLGEVSSFPVGRVEKMNMFPLDFEEFLMACSETSALQQLRKIPIADFACNKLFQLFKKYVIIGGMPEVVSNYVESKYSIIGLKDIYASIWNTYKSDIVKYAKNQTEAKIIRFVMETGSLGER